jgi:ribosomal-protein-alanine N-acetyltransferase
MKINNYPDIFKSTRLSYRPLLLDDAKAWSSFFDDPKSTQYFPDHMRGSGYLRAVHWIEKQIMRYRDKKGGLMAIESPEHGFIGQCGLLVQRIDNGEYLEVGYHLLPPFWGKGYASEAANFFRTYAQEQFPDQRIISIIHPQNQASKNVALRNNMQLWKSTKWHQMNVEIYST